VWNSLLMTHLPRHYQFLRTDQKLTYFIAAAVTFSDYIG